MLSIVVNLVARDGGCSGSRVVRSLLREALDGLGDMLLELSGGRPPVLACNDPELARLFPDSTKFPGPFPSTEWREWPGSLRHARQCTDPDADLLVLSPCLGPTSPGLLRFFLERCNDFPGRAVVAAHRYHHNLHPSWLISLPEAGEQDRVVCLDPPGTLRLESFLAPEARTCFPPRGSIRRSQDLPALYRAHGSMVLCPAGCTPTGAEGRDDAAVLPLDPGLFHPVHVLASYAESPLC